MKPYLNDLKSREKYLSGDLREFLEKENKSLVSPQNISECVDVEILQPGQDWISCKMDLHLSIRLYQAEIKNLAWQAIYSDLSKFKNAQNLNSDSLLQIDNYVTSVYDLCCDIAEQFNSFEKEYKNRSEYYPDCPTLENEALWGSG